MFTGYVSGQFIVWKDPFTWVSLPPHCGSGVGVVTVGGIVVGEREVAKIGLAVVPPLVVVRNSALGVAVNGCDIIPVSVIRLVSVVVRNSALGVAVNGCDIVPVSVISLSDEVSVLLLDDNSGLVVKDSEVPPVGKEEEISF